MSGLSKWLTFELEEEIYAVEIGMVQEVIRNTSVAAVPGSSENILGILNLRGKVVTVMDTRRKLSLSSVEINPKNRIILISNSGEEVGLLVDSVQEVVDIPQDEIDNAAPAKDFSSNKYFDGVVQHNGVLIIMLNIKNVIESELENLNNIGI